MQSVAAPSAELTASLSEINRQVVSPTDLASGAAEPPAQSVPLSKA